MVIAHMIQRCSETFSWAMVSYVGLAFGAEKSKLKVEISRLSEPNLIALFQRQSRNCWKLLLKISTPSSNWNCWNTDVITGEKFSWEIFHYVGLALGSEKCKFKVKISRHSKPNFMVVVTFLKAFHSKVLRAARGNPLYYRSVCIVRCALLSTLLSLSSWNISSAGVVLEVLERNTR